MKYLKHSLSRFQSLTVHNQDAQSLFTKDLSVLDDKKPSTEQKS